MKNQKNMASLKGWNKTDVRSEIARRETKARKSHHITISPSHHLTTSRLKASSLVEVIVAMTVIILVMAITFTLIAQVYKNSTNEIAIRKQIHLQTALSETYRNQAFIPRIYEYPELEIKQEIKSDSSQKKNEVLSISMDSTFVIKTLFVASQGRVVDR